MTPIERDHARGLNGALAAEIRSELAVRDESQSWLAEKAHMDRLTLRRYLKAERAMNTATIEVIADVLEISPSELLNRAVARRDKFPELYGPQVKLPSARLDTADEGLAQIATHVDLAAPASSSSDDDEAEAASAVDRLDRAVRDTRPASQPRKGDSERRNGRQAKNDTR